MKTIDLKHWKNAEFVQTACNLSGVLHAFLEAVQAIRKAGADTDEINEHPIVRAFADKVAALTGTQTLGNDNALKAHDEVMDYLNRGGED